MKHLSRSLRWCVVLILTSGPLVAFGKPPASPKKSAKELAKEAQVDEENNHWQAAYEKLKAAAAEKPNDKRITESFQDAGHYLSTTTANEALNACRDQKLKLCEEKAEQASHYMLTDEAKKAQSEAAAATTRVQASWDQAHKMIDAGQLEEASKELDGLTPFADVLPKLEAEKERLHTLRVSDALKRGGKAVEDRDFDGALEAYNRALKLDSSNAEANRGIDMANKGKKAMAFYGQAKAALSAKKYDAAYELNQNAVRLFPQGQEFQQFDKQLRAEWLPILEDQTALNPKPTDLPGNQAAWENLEWITHLDPGYNGLKEAKSAVSGNLSALYMAKAGDLETQPNYSRIGLAYLYHMNAQRMNSDPLAYPLAAKLTEDQDFFKRKRAMNVLISVRNLAPVPPGFDDVVEARVREQAEMLGLQDLKLFSLAKYEENPKPDTLFQDSRPDGKSSVAELHVDITSFNSESAGSETPQDKSSKYVQGQETVPNPEYQKAFEHFSEVTKELARNKHKNKPTKLHKYTETDRILADKNLQGLKETITQDKLGEYKYQEYHLSDTAHITMRLEFRDYVTKESLGFDNVDALKRDDAIETSGVREGDVNGLINRQARLRPMDQLLQDDENDALKDLDQKVPALLAKYTERYYNEGESALNEGRADDAVENFICYWRTFHDHMDDRHSQRIHDVVKQYTGLDLGGPGLVAALP